MADDKQPQRRDVLKLTGITLGSLVGGSGIGAANRSPPGRGRGLGRGRGDPSRGHRGLYVEDGTFKLDIDHGRGDLERMDEWQAVVDNFNSAIENGHISIEKQNRSGAAFDSARSTQSTDATTLEIHSTPAENSQGTPARAE